MQTGWIVSDLLDCIPSVYNGDGHIHENEIRVFRQSESYSVLAVVGALNLIAMHAQDIRENLPVVGMIFD